MKYLHRYMEVVTNDYDEVILGDRTVVVEVRLSSFRIIRETEKSYVIRGDGWKNGKPKEKFVLKGKGKRFAYDTIEAAKESYLIRKFRQIQHLEHQLKKAKAGEKAAEENKEQKLPTHFNTH